MKERKNVYNHLECNNSHRIDFVNPEILAYSPDKYKLLLLESLYIEHLKPPASIKIPQPFQSAYLIFSLSVSSFYCSVLL